MSPNNFDFQHLWLQGDPIARGIVVLLILMSIASWSVMLVKGWNLLRVKRMRREAREFWHAVGFEAGLKQLAGDDNPFRRLALVGQDATAHHAENHDELHGVLNVSDWVTSTLRQSIDETTQKLQSGLAVLASVGSTAPFIGLFGTVWGIYHALVSIGASGQATLDHVAGPVGEALIMTALGLAVAIPAVLGYNALTRGNRDVLAGLKHFAHDLHAYLITGKRLQPTGNIRPLRNQEA